MEGEHPVKVWREYRHITQEELAKAVGISIPYLSQLETNKRKGSVLVLNALAKALHITPDDVVQA
jgi:transcriptional regulator with XRE-family HTH domain